MSTLHLLCMDCSRLQFIFKFTVSRDTNSLTTTVVPSSSPLCPIHYYLQVQSQFFPITHMYVQASLSPPQSTVHLITCLVYNFALTCTAVCVFRLQRAEAEGAYSHAISIFLTFFPNNLPDLLLGWCGKESYIR